MTETPKHVKAQRDAMAATIAAAHALLDRYGVKRGELGARIQEMSHVLDAKTRHLADAMRAATLAQSAVRALAGCVCGDPGNLYHGSPFPTTRQ